MVTTFDFSSKEINGEGAEPYELGEWMNWAVIALVSDGENSKSDSLASRVIAGKKEGSPHEIKMTINGVEVDFYVVLKRLRKEFNHQVEKEAKEIAVRSIGNVSSYVSDALEFVCDRASEKIKDIIKDRHDAWDDEEIYNG